METCYGCGVKAEAHPFVGVMANRDIEGREGVGSGFADVPVCAACHTDPEHRARGLKAHFFPREARRAGVALAGSSTLG